MKIAGSSVATTRLRADRQTTVFGKILGAERQYGIEIRGERARVESLAEDHGGLNREPWFAELAHYDVWWKLRHRACRGESDPKADAHSLGYHGGIFVRISNFLHDSRRKASGKAVIFQPVAQSWALLSSDKYQRLVLEVAELQGWFACQRIPFAQGSHERVVLKRNGLEAREFRIQGDHFCDAAINLSVAQTGYYVRRA